MNSVFSTYLERIEEEISQALPFPPTQGWEALSFGEKATELSADTFQPLIEPPHSLIRLGGKRWRPLLLVLAAEAWMHQRDNLDEAEKEKLLQAAYHLVPLVEFVHTASLIHDDIEDCSDTRRGLPAAYITYGTDIAINAGSWLYFEAPSCIDTLEAFGISAEQRLRLYQSYAMELRRLHLGQAMDIAWHRNAAYCPQPLQYMTMVRNKTGTLAALAVRTGMVIAGADEAVATEAAELAAKIGIGFQIIDDVTNLSSGNPGKQRGDDIVEGKKSLPVLLFAEKTGAQSEQYAELVSCFTRARKEGIKSPAVEQAIRLLDASGAISEARTQGIAFITNGCDALEALFGLQSPAAKLINTLFASMRR